MRRDEAYLYELMQNEASFSIDPCDHSIDLQDQNRYIPLRLDPTQKIQISAMLHQMPQAFAAASMANAYTVNFPFGLPHTLTKLRQGGFGSMIQGSGGKFVGSASFNPMTAEAAALGAFTAMSAITGQYFLAQINNELAIVSDKLDDIMEFLYGEKKAELLAEISFIRYAHANYSTIMLHEQQRVATIASLQEARKIAMKDIEFYLSDLDNLNSKEAKDYASLCDLSIRALKTKDSIEMSRQLYVVSGLLELYYAQNYDDSYIAYIHNDMISYINKCDRKIVSGISSFQGKLTGYKSKSILPEKTDNKGEYLAEMETALSKYKDGSDSSLRIAINDALSALNNKAAYYIDRSGGVYIRK